MWAQMIKMRLKAGKDVELTEMTDQLKALEDPGSGLLRSTTMRDQSDPSTIYTLIVFESEQKARARENDPRRQEALEPVRKLMSEIFDGPPEFVDLDVVTESA